MLQKKRGDRSVVDENVDEIKDAGSTTTINNNNNDNNNSNNNNNNNTNNTTNNNNSNNNNNSSSSNNNNSTSSNPESKSGSSTRTANTYTYHIPDGVHTFGKNTIYSKNTTIQHNIIDSPSSEQKQPPIQIIDDNFSITDSPVNNTPPKLHSTSTSHSEELSKNNKKPKINTTNTSGNTNNNKPQFIQTKLPSSTQNTPTSTPNFSQSKSPYTYLHDILSSLDTKPKIGRLETAKIKGLCTRVIPYGKFGIEGVGLVIDDGTASVEMLPSDEVIISIVGISYSEIFKLPQAEMVKKGRSLGNMLASLDGVFNITYAVLEDGEKKFTLNTFSKPPITDIWKLCNKLS